MQKGFTLLELLVAIFILIIMSVMVGQITTNSYRGADKARSYDAVYQYGRLSIRRLSDDLTLAFLVAPTLQGRASDGTPAIETSFAGEDQGDTDKLDFATFSGARLMENEKKSDVLEVGYFVENCPDVEERINCLMRRESFVVDTNVKEGGEAFVLAKGVKKFDMEYYDSNKQEWRPDWDSKDIAFQNRLPRAARILVVFYNPRDDREEIPFETQVMIPLSTGSLDF